MYLIDRFKIYEIKQQFNNQIWIYKKFIRLNSYRFKYNIYLSSHYIWLIPTCLWSLLYAWLWGRFFWREAIFILYTHPYSNARSILNIIYYTSPIPSIIPLYYYRLLFVVYFASSSTSLFRTIRNRRRLIGQFWALLVAVFPRW